MDALAALHAAPFRTAVALPLVGPDRIRGPGYRRLMQGAHQVATDDVGHGRLIQAFRAVNGQEHVLVGISAAWALGTDVAEPTDPVAVAVRSHHRLRRRAEVVPHLLRILPEEVVLTDLGLATSPARTAMDIARGIGLPGASEDDRVARVDALLRRTGLPAQRAVEAAAAQRRLRGLPVARRVLAQCRDGVDSPRETMLRLLVVRGGLREPVVQCLVRLPSGQVVARLDLGWPDAMVGCEYDGAVHEADDQVRRDLRRHNLIREAGWTVLQVDRRQMRNPGEVLRQLRSLLCR